MEGLGRCEVKWGEFHSPSLYFGAQSFVFDYSLSWYYHSYSPPSSLASYPSAYPLRVPRTKCDHQSLVFLIIISLFFCLFLCHLSRPPQSPIHLIRHTHLYIFLL
jgi:hypothetical protein